MVETYYHLKNCRVAEILLSWLSQNLIYWGQQCAEGLRVSDSKNGARLEWWVKDLCNDLYHWIRILYKITKIILFLAATSG